MTHTCDRCERPVGDAAICSTCMSDAAKALGNVAWLEVQLALTISRQVRFTALQAPVNGSTETPVAFNVQAAYARDVLRNILVGWSKLHAEEYGIDALGYPLALDYAPPCLPPDALTAMSRFLLSRCEWFRHHALALVFIDEITASVGRCMALVDTPPRPPIFVGLCTESDPDGTLCPGEVRAFVPANESDPLHMDCDVCGKSWPTWEWRRAVPLIMARHAERVVA